MTPRASTKISGRERKRKVTGRDVFAERNTSAIAESCISSRKDGNGESGAFIALWNREATRQWKDIPEAERASFEQAATAKNVARGTIDQVNDTVPLDRYPFQSVFDDMSLTARDSGVDRLWKEIPAALRHWSHELPGFTFDLKLGGPLLVEGEEKLFFQTYVYPDISIL